MTNAIELARTILVNDPDGLYTEESEMILAQAVLSMQGESSSEADVLRAALSATPPATLVTTLFQDGEFTAASGQTLPFKIECDALSDADWEWAAKYVRSRVPFSLVEGVPEGGLKFAKALEHRHDGGRTGKLLIVDDVLTTGESMERQRNGRTAKGVVLFARGPCPDWVTPIWTLAAPDTTAIVEAKDV